MTGERTFQRSHRIRTSREYATVSRQGRRVHTQHFIVILHRAGRAESRLGLTVSRKVGNAVCRNRLKRWIREYFRLHRERWTGAVDISIIAKHPAGRLDHAATVRELQQVLARMEGAVDV